MKCEGCGEAGLFNVCMPCVKARHRAAVTRRCSCGRKRREVLKAHLGREWISCERCLGTVRQTR